MRLDEGWNQIQFNLSDFTRRAYGTNYIETLRVQIHANCRIRRCASSSPRPRPALVTMRRLMPDLFRTSRFRRIYFSDRLYSEEELPPEFKLFLPIQVRLLFRCCWHVSVLSCRADRCSRAPAEVVKATTNTRYDK